MKEYINPYIIKLLQQALSDKKSEYSMSTAIEDDSLAELISADTLKHIKMLTAICDELGANPDEAENSQKPANLRASKADNVALYRTLYFAMPHSHTDLKNMLFEIMTDELLHLSLLCSIDSTNRNTL